MKLEINCLLLINSSHWAMWSNSQGASDCWTPESKGPHDNFQEPLTVKAKVL